MSAPADCKIQKQMRQAAAADHDRLTHTRISSVFSFLLLGTLARCGARISSPGGAGVARAGDRQFCGWASAF